MSDEPKRELLPGEAEVDAWIDTLEQRADAMSDDIVERLRAHIASDHKRGCDGRCYSCDCGYDNSTDDILAKAADEIERLRKFIKRFEPALH